MGPVTNTPTLPMHLLSFYQWLCINDADVLQATPTEVMADNYGQKGDESVPTASLLVYLKQDIRRENVKIPHVLNQTITQRRYYCTRGVWKRDVCVVSTQVLLHSGCVEERCVGSINAGMTRPFRYVVQPSGFSYSRLCST